MKPGKRYIILGIVIAACVAYLALHKKDGTRYLLPTPPPVEREAITAVAVTKGGTTLRLEKRSGRWHLDPGGYPADPDRIKAMLDALRGLTLTALVSESGSYARYGLDEGSRIMVQAWAGNDVVRTLDIGTTVSTYQHTFVKLPGDGNVYHARGNVRSHFERSADDLRDKRVLSFSPSDIRRIRITAAGAGREFMRQGAGMRDNAKEAPRPPSEPAAPSRWIDEKGAATDGKTLDRLLSLCGELRCSAFAGESGADTAVPLFRLEMEGTAAHVLTVFPPAGEGAKEFPARSSGSTYPFTLPAGTGDELRTIVTELAGKPAQGASDAYK